MTREQAINYLFSCGFTNEQVGEVVRALTYEPTTKNDSGVDREDAVERLNALKHLIGYDKNSEIVKATQKSLDMAIKALEQEPVLDKIRVEIEAIIGEHNWDDYDFCSGLICARKIIDKYKAETEDT